jgi:hypothetical protein
VARVTARGAPNALGAPVGVSYAWVDSGPSGWRIRLVPDDSGAAVVEIPVHRTTEIHAESEPPYARVRADSFANLRCGRWCCSLLTFGVAPARLNTLFASPPPPRG